MTATAPPPGRPALDTAELFEPDRRDWLRLLGGVLLAAGAVVLFARKEEPWADFPLFLALLIPSVALYGLGWIGGLRDNADGVGRPEGWQTVFLILGTFLAGLTVAQFFVMLGSEDLEERLLQALVALAVAGTAYAASFLRRVPVLSLIGGLAALAAWALIWDKLIEVDTVNTGRVLLLIFAALMLAGGIALHAADRPQAAEFITVAGITAILAGLLSVSELSGVDPIDDDSGTRPTEVWNFFILVVALALVAYGARAATRGPSYVGALGLLSFVSLTGANVVALAKGDFDDRTSFIGWPLLLLFLGIAALAASFVLPRAGAGPRGGGQTTAPGGVPGAPRPGAGYGPGASPYGGQQQPQPGGFAPPQQQQPPGGFAPPQHPPPQPQQTPRPQQPPQAAEAWPPPTPPQGFPPPGQQPPGDATAARPIPPPQPDRPTAPGQPQPPPDRPTDPRQRPPDPPGGG